MNCNAAAPIGKPVTNETVPKKIAIRDCVSFYLECASSDNEYEIELAID